MKILTWNTAGRNKKIKEQFDLIKSQSPDVLCLQEIQASGDEVWHNLLKNEYKFVYSSKDFVKHRLKTGPRKYNLIIATSLPSKIDLATSSYVPWIERLLVVKLHEFQLRIATTHIPPGGNNGWVKIDFFEGLYDLLKSKNVILTGDFNSPRKEFKDGTLVTWGQRITSKGEIKLRKRIKGEDGLRWHQGEYNLLKGIGSIGYVDYFRRTHGYNNNEYSWITSTNRNIRYRFDHILGPENIRVDSIHYLNEAIDLKLSDHAPLQIQLE